MFEPDATIQIPRSGPCVEQQPTENSVAEIAAMILASCVQDRKIKLDESRKPDRQRKA